MPAAPLDRLAPEAGLDRAHLTRARLFTVLGALAIILLAAVITACAFGSVHIDLVRAFTDRAGPDHAIFFAARLPRVLMAAVVGAALAASGAALQALVRNPLAEGGILGISGAGAFGAILALICRRTPGRLGGDRAAVRLRRLVALDRRGLPAGDGRWAAGAVHAAAGGRDFQRVLGRGDHDRERDGQLLRRAQYPVLADGKFRGAHLARGRDRRPCWAQSGSARCSPMRAT